MRPCLAALIALPLCLSGAVSALAGAVSADRYSGLAIAGFDPVAYHIEGRAQAGLPDQETEHAGVAWRFASEANRAAFLRAPHLYAPRLGGFDADSAARGIAASADPALFLVIEERLYLFRTREGRERFAADPSLRAGAEAAWPRLARDVLP